MAANRTVCARALGSRLSDTLCHDRYGTETYLAGPAENICAFIVDEGAKTVNKQGKHKLALLAYAFFVFG